MNLFELPSNSPKNVGFANALAANGVHPTHDFGEGEFSIGKSPISRGDFMGISCAPRPENLDPFGPFDSEKLDP